MTQTRSGVRIVTSRWDTLRFYVILPLHPQVPFATRWIKLDLICELVCKRLHYFQKNPLSAKVKL